MIYDVSREVEDKLRAQKYPVRVYYGPERAHREPALGGVIIFERAPASESIVSPKGQQANPRKVATRQTQGRVRVYAKNTSAGARINEHEALCDYVVDAVIVAVEETITEAKMGVLSWGEARYLSPAELHAEARERQTAENRTQSYPLEQWPGVVYQLAFSFERGVMKQDWLHAARPEVAAPGFAGRTDAYLTNGPSDAEPSTGCGG